MKLNLNVLPSHLSQHHIFLKEIFIWKKLLIDFNFLDLLCMCPAIYCYCCSPIQAVHTLGKFQCTACFRLLLRGPMLLWQQLVPGDLMGTSWLVPSSYIGPKWHIPEMALQKKSFLALPSTPLGKKPWFFAIVTGWCIGFIKRRGVAGQTSFFHGLIRA